MLKFTSVSGSVRATTEITLTITIIRTDIIELAIDPITVRIGAAGIVIIVITIVIPIITGNSLTGIATPGAPAAREEAVYFPDFGEAAGLVTGLLPGSSSWNSFLNC